MDKKTLQWLAAGFGICVLLAWGLLFASFSRGWIEFAPHDQTAGKIILPIAAFFGVLLLFALIGIGIYVYRDARRRGMEPLLWTLVAVLVPYFIGLIIYLVVRQPLQATCPSCAARMPLKAVYCPACGRPVQRSCSGCQTAIQNGARFCHACGAAVPQG